MPRTEAELAYVAELNADQGPDTETLQEKIASANEALSLMQDAINSGEVDQDLAKRMNVTLTTMLVAHNAACW